MGALIPYFGGKTRLAKTITSKIPAHTCYVEVFAGGAAVFFKKQPSQTEVLNDLDKGLVTLYRVVKNHPEELHKQFKYSLISRAEFEREKDVNAETLTDIQRAARYLYLQKTSFGGKVSNRVFGTSTTSKPRLNILNLETTIEQAWQRLVNVQIECLDFRQLILKYDREHTFFFLDPPYWNIPGYNHDFEEQDFVDLVAILKRIKGSFLLTVNDTPETRELFSPFKIEEVNLKYSMSRKEGSRSKQRTELLISG